VAVSFEAGFQLKSGLNREFRRRFGMSPTALRASAGIRWEFGKPGISFAA
jgi:AraC-like DNA-binding protein